MIIAIVLYVIFILFQITYLVVPIIVTRKSKRITSRKLPEKKITILIPAYNEARVIKNCLQGIINIRYSSFETIIINDGSFDETLDILKEELQLKYVNKINLNQLMHSEIIGCYQSGFDPRIYVLDKLNGGKADSLNAGINFSASDIIVTLDADSTLDSDSLIWINQAYDDKKIIAAGGMVQVAQGLNHIPGKYTSNFNVSGLIRYQIIQYLSSFYCIRVTQAKLKALNIISGAFGIFNRQTLINVNGYRKTIGEDMDITLRIQKYIKTKAKDKKLIFIPEAVCYTECPENYRDLFRQRFRWQKAFLDCILKYYKDLFKYFGIRMSLFLFLDSLILGTITALPTMLAPIYLFITGKNSLLALLLFISSYILGLFQSIVAFLIQNRYNFTYSPINYLRIIIFAPFEVITYRLFGLIYAIVGSILFIFNRNSWNKVDRLGKNYYINLTSNKTEKVINTNS